jgi:hypothetical protein
MRIYLRFLVSPTYKKSIHLDAFYFKDSLRTDADTSFQ